MQVVPFKAHNQSIFKGHDMHKIFCHHRHFRLVLIFLSLQCHFLCQKKSIALTCSVLKMLEVLSQPPHVSYQKTLMQTPLLSYMSPHVICSNLSLKQRENSIIVVFYTLLCMTNWSSVFIWLFVCLYHHKISVTT